MNNEELKEWYIQDSRYLEGNAILFWGENRSGYTYNLDKAGLYTKEEAFNQYKSRRTDIPWHKDDVERAVQRMCNADYLTRDKELYSDIISYEEDRKLQDIEDKKEYDRNYLSIELEILYDSMCSLIRADNYDIEYEIEEAQGRCDFNRYYFPILFNKSEDEIRELLIKNEYILFCNKCNSYYSKDLRSDSKEVICENCFDLEEL